MTEPCITVDWPDGRTERLTRAEAVQRRAGVWAGIREREGAALDAYNMLGDAIRHIGLEGSRGPAAVMGHSSTETTMGYVKISPHAAAAGIESISTIAHAAPSVTDIVVT